MGAFVLWCITTIIGVLISHTWVGALTGLLVGLVISFISTMYVVYAQQQQKK